MYNHINLSFIVFILTNQLMHTMVVNLEFILLSQRKDVLFLAVLQNGLASLPTDCNGHMEDDMKSEKSAKSEVMSAISINFLVNPSQHPHPPPLTPI